MKNILNKYCFQLWSKYCLTSFSIVSTILLFVPNIPEDKQYIKFIIGGFFVVTLFISYFLIYWYEIKTKKIKLVINNTEVNVLFGDIFKISGKKVIAFNEYFDTLVDDLIIAKKSLNGQAIINGAINKEKFDQLIQKNIDLIKTGINQNRKVGKQQRYELGQIQPYEDFFALAFSHFDSDNKAYLCSNDYANCLLAMWKQLNKFYSQNVVNIPLLGSGITRILDNCEASNQELLEIMLETLKISKMTFKEPSKINIVLYPGEKNENLHKYDLVRIKYIFRR